MARPLSKDGKLRRKYAKEYHCQEQTVRAWMKAGAPLEDKQAMRKWLSGRQVGNDDIEPEDLQTAKLAKINIETKRIAFKLAAEQNEYTHNSEVIAIGVRRGAMTRVELMALISEAPTWAGLDAASLQDRAREFVSGALERLSSCTQRK